MSASEITVTLPDGTQKKVAAGTPIGTFVAEQIGRGLAKAALGAKLNGKTVDLFKTIDTDASLEVLTPKSEGGQEMLRHSAAHVVASAVQRLFPKAKVTIGPVVPEVPGWDFPGFYYDFDYEAGFTPEELQKIEEESNRVVKENVPFSRRDLPIDEAIGVFEKMGENFKVEIIRDLAERGESVVSLYRHGEFEDLCRGPHIPETGRIGVIKLAFSSGAYWRGDHRNKQLQRVYGMVFPDQKSLDAHLALLEEARRRDHRKLGKELELFITHHYAPGAAFWLPKGTVLYQTLSDAMRRMLLAEGYGEVKTPLIFNKALWETSGHWEKYRENMFMFESEEQTFSLKPMNCPSHMLIFGSRKRSYRELPMRLHDQGVLHRNEPSGALGGLTRVRQFSQDDAHLFVTEEQIGPEVSKLVALVDRVYSAFGLAYSAKLSTRPAKFLGEIASWDRAEKDLAAALASLGLQTTIAPGEGAFYGPKIDFDVTDSLKRRWQCATIQLDSQMPSRFGLTYIGEDGKEHTPVVIHRAIFGSFERFIAILIEHYAGAFPTWLAPVQARVLTVSDRFLGYGREVADVLRARGLRVELDEASDKLGAKIREAEIAKIPYAVVVGEKESQQRGVSPRRHGAEDLKLMGLDAFTELLVAEARPPFGK
jgi:threonyl-tRNA synthetase